MTQTEKKNKKIEVLKQTTVLLKTKIAEREKTPTDDFSQLAKVRGWRKSLKRTQRKMALLEGKKSSSAATPAENEKKQ